jgi:hypothetical protein
MKGSSLTPVVIAINLIAGLHTLMSFATPDSLEESLRYQRGGASLRNVSLDLTPRTTSTNVDGLKMECTKPGLFNKLLISGPDTICK